MDGGEFIRQIIPKELVKIFKLKEEEIVKNNDLEITKKSFLNFHVPMNLPGISAKFLPNFRGFLKNFPETR